MAKKSPSRPKRWAAAASAAEEAFGKLEEAISELKEVQEEYSDWHDSLPDNLQDGMLAEKLGAVVELDFDCLSDVSDVVEEANAIDLPLGFGRD